MKIAVGDFIKSYDFVNDYDCYLIGLVKEIKNGAAVCETLFQVFAGKRDDDFPKEFTTPLLGNYIMDEMYPNFKRIEMIWSNN